jgi:hypothetical protein
MTVAGEFYPLRMWERITDAKDGGYWRTPLATDGEKSGHGNLPHQVKWPTPAAYNGNQGPKSKELFDLCLKTGQSMITLVDAVRHWPTPKKQDSRAALWDRGKCNLGEVVHGMEGAITGSLNPTWVEWLMGYPSEWTVLEDWAIPLCRPKREKRLKG